MSRQNYILKLLKEESLSLMQTRFPHLYHARHQLAYHPTQHH